MIVYLINTLFALSSMAGLCLTLLYVPDSLAHDLLALVFTLSTFLHVYLAMKGTE